MKKIILLMTTACLLWACDDILVPNISDETVNLLAPAEGFVGGAKPITLWWDYVPSAFGYTVTIVSPSFDDIQSLAFEQDVEDGNQLDVTLPAGRYEWSVIAYNDSYATDGYLRTLVVLDSLTDIRSMAPSLMSPASDTCLATGTINFDWEAIIGATSYRWQLAQPDFSDEANITMDVLLSDLSTQSTLAAGNYQWRVRGENNLTESTYQTASFKVQ